LAGKLTIYNLAAYHPLNRTALSENLNFYFSLLQVDILNLRYVFAPLQWIGMNAMLVYVMAASGVLEGFLNGWYYEGTNNTLVRLRCRPLDFLG
jgi:hypothetical protein